MGVGNTDVARTSAPSMTTLDYDISFSGHGIVDVLLQRSDTSVYDDGLHQVEERLRVIQGKSLKVHDQPHE
jgi:hypothetical protein